MKTDKVFILMLVIMLPLTGCIDVSDNADAQDASDSEESETTVINNYYNTTTVQSVQKMEAMSHYLPKNQTLNLSFDGTYTYKLETLHYEQWGYGSGSPLIGGNFDPNAERTWTTTTANNGANMTCSSGFQMDGFRLNVGDFLPVLPNDACEISIPNGDYRYVFVFSNHTLG